MPGLLVRPSDPDQTNTTGSYNPNYQSPTQGYGYNQVYSPGMDSSVPASSLTGGRRQLGSPLPGEEDTYPTYQTNTLSKQNPLPWQVYLPGQATDLAGQINNRALSGSDNAQRDELLNYGVNNTAPTKTASSLESNSVSAQSQAINNKASSSIGNNLDSIKAQNMINANPELRESQELSRAADIYGKDAAINMQNFKEQYNYEQQRQQMYVQYQNAQKQAQGQTLASILGLVGTAAAIAL